MITKRTIGKVQVVIGIILFVTVLISSFFIIKNVYLGSLILDVEGITGTWGQVEREINGTTIGVVGHVISNVLLQSQIVKTTATLFGASALILLVLSIIIFLQGLSKLVIE